MRRAARIALPALLALIWSTLGVVRPVTEWLREANLLRATVAAAFVAVAIGAAAALARERALRTARGAAVVAGVAAIYALVVWPLSSPEEKIHFVEYGLVAVLADLAAPGRWRAGPRFVACALFTAAAGWIDEAIQWFLPGRVYDLRDVAFNAAAGLLALTALAALRRARHLEAARPSPTTDP